MDGMMRGGMGVMDGAQGWAAAWLAMGISALAWTALLVLAVLAIVWLLRELGGPGQPTDDEPAPRGY